MTKDASLTVRIEPDLKASLEDRAAAQGVRLSALVVSTLRRAALRWNKNGAAASHRDDATSTAVRSESNAASLHPARKRTAT